MKCVHYCESDPLLLQANNWQPDDELRILSFSYGAASVSINFKTDVYHVTEYGQLIDSFIGFLCALDAKKHELQKLTVEFNSFSRPANGRIHSSLSPYSRGWHLLDFCCDTLVNGCFTFITFMSAALSFGAIMMLIAFTLVMNFGKIDKENYDDIAVSATLASWMLLFLIVVLLLWGACNWQHNGDCFSGADIKVCNLSSCCANISPHRDVYIDRDPQHLITRQYKNKCRRYKNSMYKLKRELKKYEIGNKGAIGLIAAIVYDYAGANHGTLLRL